MDEQHRLSEHFADLAAELTGDHDLPLTFQRVVDRALETVSTADHVGLHLRKRRGQARSVASTDEVAATADDLQDELGEGPCVDAAFEQENFVVHDLRDDGRWPTWAARVAALGVLSSFSIRLTAHDETVGALNLYADRPGAFDGDQDVALIFASHAAQAMTRARLVSGLRNALDSRHTIGIAQGVLAVRFGITYERAFQVLHRYSNDHNLKLRDLAETVIEHRGLPEELDG